MVARWGRRRWHSRPVRSRMPGKSVKFSRAASFKLGRGKLVLIIFLVLFFFAFQTFVYIERHLQPPLMQVASLRVKQIATQAINKAISEQVEEHSGSNFEKLVDWKTDANGKISGFMLNYAEHMRITAETANTVQQTLMDIKDIPEHVPIGEALNSAIIASFGPRVPVKFKPVGAVKVDLNTRQTDAGINMILVEVYIRVLTEVAIIIPFDTKPEVLETEIPISYLLVVGDVPMYYYDNKGNPVGGGASNAPNISLPMDGNQSSAPAGTGDQLFQNNGTAAPPSGSLPADPSTGIMNGNGSGAATNNGS